MKILPRTKTPELSLETVERGRFTLSGRKPRQFTLLVFYRGLHCGKCRAQLQELEEYVDRLEQRGVELVAISMDGRERAERSVREWELDKVTVAYGLPAEEALAWGLFLSRSIKDKEPALFSEPGIFIVTPERTLQASSVQTMPRARPTASLLFEALDEMVDDSDPARGEATLEG